MKYSKQPPAISSIYAIMVTAADDGVWQVALHALDPEMKPVWWMAKRRTLGAVAELVDQISKMEAP